MKNSAVAGHHHRKRLRALRKPVTWVRLKSFSNVMFSAKKLSPVIFTVAECSVRPFCPALRSFTTTVLLAPGLLLRIVIFFLSTVSTSRYSPGETDQHLSLFRDPRRARAGSSTQISCAVCCNIEIVILRRNLALHIGSGVASEGNGIEAHIAVVRLSFRRIRRLRNHSHIVPSRQKISRVRANRDLRILVVKERVLLIVRKHVAELDPQLVVCIQPKKREGSPPSAHARSQA